MQALRSVNKYLYKYRYRLVAGIFFIALSNVFGVLSPVFVRGGVDLVLKKAKLVSSYDFTMIPGAYVDDFYKGVLYFSFLTIFFAILRGVFMFFMRQSVIVMSRHIEYDQKNELYKKYQSLDVLFYKKHYTGDLMTRLTEDISRVRTYYGPGLMYTLNLLILTMLVVYQMIRVSPQLAAYSMIPLPVMLVCIFILNRKVERKSRAIQEQLSALNTYVQEAYSGIRVIKAFVRQQVFTREFEGACNNYRKRTLSLVKLEAVYFPVIALLVGISLISTIYFGGKLVESGALSPGVIVEFVIYINMITWPFASVGWVTALIQQANVSQQRINEFLYADPEMKSGNEIISSFKSEIVFDDVSFTYPVTQIEAVQKVSFKIMAGSKVAIVGKTGSGKSTLAMLLARAFDTTAGTVFIDGKDIRTLDSASFHKLIGYVPQDVFIFSDTIKNNIAFGLEQDDITDITSFAKAAMLDSDINGFKEKYETWVGERGVTLSGGQKQRLAIARALSKKPNILILDDALSAVDATTEERLMKNLTERIQGTIVLVTHRLSAIRDFNQILVMKDGAIIEQGKHEELMKRRGAYFELYSHRSEEVYSSE